jgi:hypothetical protein
MKLTGHVAYMGGMRNAYNILVGEPEEKSPLVDDCTIDFRERG